MIFICFQDLLKVSVWDPINLPSDCCWSCDYTWYVWCWDKTFISIRWPARSFPRSMWVKKFNLQIAFMHIHYSHYANPPKCIIDTANIQKIQCFYIYFFCQWFVKIKLKKFSIASLCVYEQFCCKISVQNGYSLFQAGSLTLQSHPPGQHGHWPILPDLHQKIWRKQSHKLSIDW